MLGTLCRCRRQAPVKYKRVTGYAVLAFIVFPFNSLLAASVPSESTNPPANVESCRDVDGFDW